MNILTEKTVGRRGKGVSNQFYCMKQVNWEKELDTAPAEMGIFSDEAATALFLH